MPRDSAAWIWDRLDKVRELAVLPEVMVRILDVVNNPASTALDLAREVARDQALTAKVLRLVNSGHYGFVREIRTIPEAIVILGFDELERLAVGTLLVNTFGKDRERVQAMRLLWRHSLACSIAAEVFEQQLKRAHPEAQGAHVAALLHDVGKAVIAQHFPEETMHILERMREKSLAPVDAEREVLGADHCTIGQWVARRWALPESYIEAIAGHHEMDAARPDQIILHITHASNEACKSLGMRSAHPQAQPALHPASRALVSLEHETLCRIRDQLDASRHLIGAITAGAMFA